MDEKINKLIASNNELKTKVVRLVVAGLENPEKGILTIEGVADFLEQTASDLRHAAMRMSINEIINR